MPAVMARFTIQDGAVFRHVNSDMLQLVEMRNIVISVDGTFNNYAQSLIVKAKLRREDADAYREKRLVLVEQQDRRTTDRELHLLLKKHSSSLRICPR